MKGKTHERIRRRRCPVHRRPWRAAGEQVAVATVTETWGSSPRPAGSQMAVTKSGRMAGSVSGGCIEGAVAEAAMKTIEYRQPATAGFRRQPRTRLGSRAGLRRQGQGVRRAAELSRGLRALGPGAAALGPHPAAMAAEGLSCAPLSREPFIHEPRNPRRAGSGEAGQAPGCAGDPVAVGRATPAARSGRARRLERGGGAGAGPRRKRHRQAGRRRTGSCMPTIRRCG